MSGNTMGTCPLGGLWYTCTAQTPTFMGCCTSNPCQGNGKTCPSSDLRAAGMGTGSGPDLTSNDASYWPNVQCSVGLWWTCAMQTPSFQGCCETNPCGGDGKGCPSGSLHPAAFKTVPSDPAYGSTSSVRTTTSLSTTSTSLSAGVATSSTLSAVSYSATTKTSQTGTPAPASATSSSTSIPVGSTIPINPNSDLPIGAIAGGAVGGVVILVIGLLIFCFCRKRRQKQSSHYSDVQPAMTSNGGDPSLFLTKGDEYSQKQTIAEGYYANQPILGSQKAAQYTSLRTSSPPVSPGPPPYQSGQVSSNRNLHEMESSHISTGGRPINALGFHYDQPICPVSHSRNVSGVLEDGDGIAELPHSPATESRWRSKRPDNMASVEIGESSPRVSDMSPASDGGLGVVDNGKKARESYVSWQSLSP